MNAEARSGARNRLVIALVFTAGAAASVGLSWPGQFSPDSVWQLQQGRSGLYNGWHPPVMAWLLGLFDWIAPGAPGFIVMDAVLGFAGLLAFAILPRRPGRLSIALAILICASPLMLIYQGDVWKDVLFADAAVAGFAALAWSARAWSARPARYGLAGLAFALMALAALVRQNGIILAPFGAAAFGVIAWRQTEARRLVRAIGHALAGLGLCLAIVAAGASALALRSDGEAAQAGQVEWLQVWDLAGAVRADPGFDLRVLRTQSPVAAVFVRQVAAPAWRAQRIDPLIGLPGADAALDGASAPIARQWRALVASRPDLYARVRLTAFGQLVATPDLMACRPLFVGVDGPPDMLKAAGLKPRIREKDAWMRRYGLAFVGGPVLSHLIYGVLALVLLALMAREAVRGRAEPEALAVAGLLLASLVFAASFLVIGIACDYRYLYALDLAAMAGAVYQAARKA